MNVSTYEQIYIHTYIHTCIIHTTCILLMIPVLVSCYAVSKNVII